MHSIALFSLETHEGPYEKWPRMTRLFADGADTGKRVPGYIIEAQYKCRDGYLIATSQDCPFEESNDFVLLNEAFESVAQTSLGAMYSSFLIESHWPISDSAIRIHYYEDFFYTLTISRSSSRFQKSVSLVLHPFTDFRGDPKAVEAIATREARERNARERQTRE